MKFLVKYIKFLPKSFNVFIQIKKKIEMEFEMENVKLLSMQRPNYMFEMEYQR